MSAQQWTATKIRQTFVEFFEQRGHQLVKSSPVVPQSDPTLLFANAGMNQFKPLFLGTADPNTEFGRLKRAVNSQMCIRAGGKHNDLEDVGKDTYHHTFFEMLGNWSFGDYFKAEAIEWAWTLLTEVFGLDKERMYVTYFEGNEKCGLKPDEETKNLWRKYVPEERILKGSMKDNFWEMGDTGPCGPCSEIHYDHIGGRDASSRVNRDDPMVVEVWNIVFMQFNREGPDTLVPLPSPHVDTGMGFERLTAALQGVKSNYDTDVWQPIFAEIQRITEFPEAYDPTKMNDVTVAYRVIADHIRCLTMALSDGAVPDSVGRGFVLRRIIRRAVRFGVQFLNAKTGFFSQLVDVVVAQLGGFFAHIAEPKNVVRVKAILLDEEESFAKTWKVGLKRFEEAKAAAVAANSNIIPGKDAFVLHDRYGFPIDLTGLLAEKEGMTVDVAGFQEEMKQNQVGGGRVAVAKTFFDTYQIDELQNSLKVPVTDDTPKYVWVEAAARVLAVFDKPRCKFVEAAAANTCEGDEIVGLVLDTTNFYAEAGGQIYDQGRIVGSGGAFEVSKVLGFAGYIVHIGCVAEGTIKVGEEVKLQVNLQRRLPIAANHTATHQLNHALRQVLQYEKEDNFLEVHQKGSLVTEDQLRFDFSFNSKVQAEDVEKIEALVNAAIKADLKVFAQDVPLAQAREINSLRMMFDEKYPDPVRVVCVGTPIERLLADPSSGEWRNYSIEFCGGTHLESLGAAGGAVIVSEEALMKGIRRVVVLTKEAAKDVAKLGAAFEDEFDAICGAEGIALDDKVKQLSIFAKKVNDTTLSLVLKGKLRDKVEAAIRQFNAGIKQLAAERKAAGLQLGGELAAAIPPSDKFLLHVETKFAADREPLQAVADGVAKVRPDVGVFLVGVDEAKGKAMALITLPDSMVKKGGLSAVAIAKECCGKGGGKPNAAQSGVAADDVPKVVSSARDAIQKMTAKLA